MKSEAKQQINER